MRPTLNILTAIAFAMFASAPPAGAAEGVTVAPFASKPFWEGKPKLETKLKEERAVLVSVRTDKGVRDKNADLFSINGVGYVRREADVVFNLAKRFDRLKEISDVFREVKFEPKTNRVFVICQALGYQARMLIQVEPTLKPVREIRFRVVDGHFLGLEGIMGFRELSREARTDSRAETEVSLRVQHEAREIPIPKFLVGFALEVLIQKVALKMRTYFEETAAPIEAAGVL